MREATTMSEAIATREGGGLAARHELTVAELLAQVAKVQEMMKHAMKQDEHYGVIPGTGTKPSLLKPGAEKLCLLFRLDPQYEQTEIWRGDHLIVKSKCTLYHIPTGLRMGSGTGMCSTLEAKYRYRKALRECPKCGAKTIRRSQFPPRHDRNAKPGWWCNNKGNAGGCGADFYVDDPLITSQTEGDTENPNLADQWNTVEKMADKRALVAGVLNVTAASDIFTQDLEDIRAAEALIIEGEVVKEKPDNGALGDAKEEGYQQAIRDTAKPKRPVARRQPAPSDFPPVRTEIPSDEQAERESRVLFPSPDEANERTALLVEAQRLLKKLDVKPSDRAVMKQEYLGTQDPTTADIAALVDLVNFLRSRCSPIEAKWGQA